MASRIQYMRMAPWIGGINSALDESMIPANQLTLARNVEFGTRGARKKRDGINFNWDGATTEQFTATCVGASDITTGQYFTINAGGDTTAFYVWYNKDAGGGDPAPGGKTAIEVAVTTGDSANTVASATQAAIDGNANFSATVSTNVVTVTCAASGTTTDAANVDVGGSFAITMVRQGIDTTSSVIGLHDFHYGAASRTQRLVAVLDSKEVRHYDQSDGTRSEDIFAGTAWSSAITNVSMVTFNNKVLIAVDGSGNVPKEWNGTTFQDLQGSPTACSVLAVHLDRVWTNDKTNLDRIHYSETGNEAVWNGSGDSGALDVGIGDGDSEGVTAIFPFKGVLFVAKKTKLYRVDGYTPESFRVSLVSDGIGCVGPNAFATIDQDDIFFVSGRGVHSLAATERFGDVESQFVSADIQGDFNDNLSISRLKYCWGGYLSSINSAAFTFTDDRVSTTANKTIYLYNIPLKSWYTWHDLDCESLTLSEDSDKKRFYLGGTASRVAKTQNGTFSDIDSTGANAAVEYTVKTGVIYVDDDPNSEKAFYEIGLLYAPRSESTVTLTAKIDNYPLQSFSFAESSGADKLGSAFTLNQSLLGSSAVMAPYMRTLDGVGRGIQLTLTQSGTEEEVEVQGFVLGYENIGTRQEVVGT